MSAEVLEGHRLRVRCGRILDTYRRCGNVLIEGRYESEMMPIVLDKPMFSRPHIDVGRGRPRGGPAFAGLPEVQPLAERVTIACNCGAHHVLKTDRMIPALVDRAASAKNGRVDIYTGEF